MNSKKIVSVLTTVIIISSVGTAIHAISFFSPLTQDAQAFFFRRRRKPKPPSIQQKQPTTQNQSEYNSALLELTNAERQKAGLPPLRFSSTLGQAAQDHAEDMVRNNFFDHAGSNGSQPAQRAKKRGYSSSYIGENIAAGNTTPEETIRQWMNSSGHRENILSANYTEIGFGYVKNSSYKYGHVWVQVFGSPR
ncbi:CAP domain-containing protein [Calothrix sp. UHCC 0171]|uniref:CAP domain-containing protein n=1 Tax=Calothrix sp. UHCC 0171 TaxID=3110245 RepID=UPI002B1F48B9|nr:CAP domain-containing protein [Calothrix sp. UHCC 0171]MEA5573016.1 CAP domain-containing protein [Calothrix sp. UHCC 0171]